MPDVTQKRRGRPASNRPEVRRKNLNIDQGKLDRAVEALGLSTETEAVDQALDLLLLHAEGMAGLRRLGGRGYEIDNLYDQHLDL